MADPLSIIASVVAVSTAALQSAQILFQLIDGIKNVPEEITAISNDTHAFYDIVLSLETSLKDEDVVGVVRENTAMVAMLANIENPLHNCSATLGQFMLKIRSRVKSTNDGKGSRFSSGARWYFRKKDIKELLDRLGQNKATLNAALNTISAFCQLRLMATNGQEPDDWSSMVNGCGSMGTDVGFSMSRFVQGTSLVNIASTSPPPPMSDTDDHSQHMEKGLDPLSDSELNWSEVPKALETNHGKYLIAPREICDVAPQKDALGEPALLDAVTCGDNLAVLSHLSQGAEVNAKCIGDGRPALHFATKTKAENVLWSLLRYGAEAKAKTVPCVPGRSQKESGEKTALHKAARNGDESIVRLMIENGADVSARSTALRTPLDEAITRGSLNIVRMLIENGASINTSTYMGRTPLHSAAMGRYSGEPRSDDHGSADVTGERLKIMRLLLYNGGDIEARTVKTSATPLHLAAEMGQTKMVQLLIEEGADIRAQNKFGLRPVHYAAKIEHSVLVRLLEALLEK